LEKPENQEFASLVQNTESEGLGMTSLIIIVFKGNTDSQTNTLEKMKKIKRHY
jgi:hypothetical protein